MRACLQSCISSLSAMATNTSVLLLITLWASVQDGESIFQRFSTIIPVSCSCFSRMCMTLDIQWFHDLHINLRTYSVILKAGELNNTLLCLCVFVSSVLHTVCTLSPVCVQCRNGHYWMLALTHVWASPERIKGPINPNHFISGFYWCWIFHKNFETDIYNQSYQERWVLQWQLICWELSWAFSCLQIVFTTDRDAKLWLVLYKCKIQAGRLTAGLALCLRL